MPQQLSPEQIEHLARKRAAAKLGWYVHACVYVLVNLMLTVIASHSDRPWSIYPILGWGVGLVMHGVSVFVLGTGSGFRERLIERERERLRRQQDRQ